MIYGMDILRLEYKFEDGLGSLKQIIFTIKKPINNDGLLFVVRYQLLDIDCSGFQSVMFWKIYDKLSIFIFS